MGAIEQIERVANDSRWMPLDEYYERPDDPAPAAQAEQRVSSEEATVSGRVLKAGGVAFDPEAGCPVAAAYGPTYHMGE